MYQEFFGLKDDPFRLNPDPRYLYMTPSAQEALTSLAYGIRGRHGMIVMTGEVGTGKTTLLRALLDALKQVNASVAFVFNPRVSVEGLISFVMSDFGIPCQGMPKHEVLAQLNRWLLERSRLGQMVVLMIDEAQHLSNDALEEVRLLTNLETSTEKLLQIVLSGQPELEEKLRDANLRQVKQRITIRCRTAKLSDEETNEYINRRLEIAGANGSRVFSPEAVEKVYEYSLGIPRVVNLLCSHALIHALADQKRVVSADHVRTVAREFDLTEQPRLPLADDHDADAFRRWQTNHAVHIFEDANHGPHS
jgi:general secretion pathway protein A